MELGSPVSWQHWSHKALLSYSMQEQIVCFLLHLILPNYAKRQQKPFPQKQYKASRGSMIPAHQLLRCSSFEEDTPGENSVILIVSFLLEHSGSSLIREIQLPTVQTNCSFQVWKLLVCFLSARRRFLPVHSLCVQSVVTLSASFSPRVFLSYCLFIALETFNFSNNDPDDYNHFTQP